MEMMEECCADDVDHQESTKEKHSSRTNRIMVCIGIVTGSIWSGMAEDCAIAVSTTLEEPIPSDRASHFQTWAVSTGIVCSYFLMKMRGRKKCLLMANIVSFIACIVLLIAQQKETALVGCVLLWISRTAYLTTVRIYASEITSPQLRGFLGVLISLAIVFGSILNFIFRMLAKGRYGVRACFAMSIMTLMLTSYKKESPYWLHHQTKTDEARYAFLWIRGNDTNVKELCDLLAAEGNPKAKILTKQFFNASIIVASLMLVKTANGLYLMNEQQMRILQAEFNSNNHICSIFLDSLRIFASSILCALILKVRRRTLFFTSVAGTLTALLSWSCVKSFSPSMEMNLLPLVIFHNIFVFVGVGEIPWILATEIFSNQSRDLGFCCSSLLFLLLEKFIPHEETIINYWLQCIQLLLSSIVAYFIMPETFGITLQAAENMISTKLLKYFRI